MKKNKWWTLLLLSVVVLVGCEQTDAERLPGKWKYARMENEGKVILSDDRNEAGQIIDKHVLENMDYIRDVSKFRDNAEKEMEQRLNVFFEFGEDSSVTISDLSSGESMVEKWKYTLDEEKHEMTLSATGNKQVYKYQLKKDELTLRSDSQKITLKRAKE